MTLIDFLEAEVEHEKQNRQNDLKKEHEADYSREQNAPVGAVAEDPSGDFAESLGAIVGRSIVPELLTVGWLYLSHRLELSTFMQYSLIIFGASCAIEGVVDIIKKYEQNYYGNSH